jgi:hypothetical protein
MNKEDIVRMAREAGAVFPADGSYHRFESEDSLEDFAALVASAEREKFCAMLRQVHDSYSLSSEQGQLKNRGQA